MVPGVDMNPGDGVQRHVYEISKRLTSEEFTVMNIQPSINNKFEVITLSNNYKLIKVPVSTSGKVISGCANACVPAQTLGHYLFYKQAVETLLRRIDGVSIIHTHGFYSISQPLKKSTVGRVTTFHGSVPMDMINKGQSITKAKLLNSLLKPIYKKADKWTAISPMVRMLAANLYDINLEDISLTPHGVNATFFSTPASIEEVDELNSRFNITNANRITFVGHLDRNKRIDLLLQALALLKNWQKDAQLIIKSSWGDYYDEALHMVERLGIKSRVTVITEHLSEVQLRALYQTSNVFIGTYANQTGYSTALLEAMASGVPPIICKGSNEDVVDESTGILLRHFSAKELANCICTLLEDRKMASKFGKKAMQRAISTFDWDNAVIPKYLRVYKALLNEIK